MKSTKTSSPFSKPRRSVFGILYFLILTLGALFLWQSWYSSVQAIEHDAIAVATAVESTLDIDKISDLKAAAADEESESYKFIKNKLVRFAAVDEEVRFVYLFTQRDGKIIILADSELPTSGDYSPPGQEYNEANAAYFEPFNAGNTKKIIAPIVDDRWGSWKTVLVPIYKPDSGELIAVLGVDYPVKVWFMPAIIEMIQTAGILIAILMLAIAINNLFNKNLMLKQKTKELLFASNAALVSEHEHKLLISQMQQGFAVHEIICDESGKPVDYRFISVNDSFEKLTGLAGKDILGKTVLQVMPETEPYWINAYGKVALTGEPFEFEKYFAELDKYFHVTAYSPQSNRFAVIITDTSERKIAENTLREREEKYRNIFEYSPVGIYNFDTNGLIVDCNDCFVSIIGSSRELLIGLDMLRLPDLRIVACIKAALQGEVAEYRGAYHSTTADKKTPIRGLFSPILSNTGAVIGGTGIVEDITERQRLGDELRLKSLVLDQLEERITITDLDGVITYINKIQAEVLGLPAKEIIGSRTDVYGEDPDKGASQREIFETTLKEGVWRGEVVNFTADGRELIMDCRTQVISNIDGEKVALAGIAADITGRKMMERDLYVEKERLRTTLLSIGDGVIATDAEGRITVLNRIAEELTGFSRKEARGKPLEDVFHIISEFSGERSENPVNKVLSSGKIFELSNHTILVARDGTKRYIEDSAAPIKSEHDGITGVVLVFRDVTDKQLKQKEIEYLSFHDQLTGLYNRRYYEQEVLRLDEEKYYPLTLVMTDVNGLKLTNDAFGHKAGDLLLQKIAEIMKRECRAKDVVARIGGDEFVLLLPKTDAMQAETIIARINTAIANEKFDSFVMSIAVGYAVKESNSVSMNEIFTKAEDAMYRNKLTDSSDIQSKTINQIMVSLFAKNERELFHSKRVGELCEAIATEMGFSQPDIDQIRLAGLMHDIGKIGISEAVLNKEGKLNAKEWSEIERHSEIGYRILGSVNEFAKIADYVLEHHERIDGKGYPRGLTDTEISLQAKIIMLADAYDAMTSDRPYRQALSKEQAIKEIKKHSGMQFDRSVAEVFVEMVLGEKWV